MDSDKSSETEVNNNDIHIPNNYQRVEEVTLLNPENLPNPNKEVILFELPKNVKIMY